MVKFLPMLFFLFNKEYEEPPTTNILLKKNIIEAAVRQRVIRNVNIGEG